MMKFFRRLKIGKKGEEKKAEGGLVCPPLAARPEMIHSAEVLRGWTRSEGGVWATVAHGAEFTVSTGRGGPFVCRCVKAYDQGMIAEVLFLDSECGHGSSSSSGPGYTSQFTVSWSSVVEMHGMMNALTTAQSRAAQGPSLAVGQRIRACSNPCCSLGLWGKTVDVTTDVIRLAQEVIDDEGTEAGWSRVTRRNYGARTVEAQLYRVITEDGLQMRVCERCVQDAEFVQNARDLWGVDLRLRGDRPLLP